jgi:3-methylcrotonyl-CoA carboxylase alpha subunit
MSGTVQQVDVAAGDVVASGDRLLVLAAMKMEYALTAPRDGVIADVACAAGDAVGDAALLVRLEAVDD